MLAPSALKYDRIEMPKPALRYDDHVSTDQTGSGGDCHCDDGHLTVPLSHRR